MSITAGRATGIRPVSAKATLAAYTDGLEREVTRKDTHDRPGFKVNSSTAMLFRGLFFFSSSCGNVR